MKDDAAAISGEDPFFIAIGASGGEGLDDIRRLLSALPATLRAVVLVVLHRPSDRVSHLREVLSRASAMPVLLATEDERFRVGHCYIGEPDAHLSLTANSRVRLIEGADHSHRKIGRSISSSTPSPPTPRRAHRHHPLGLTG